jgi:hypothetical protein
MTPTPRRQEPAGYRLRVDGHLDQHWSSWFGNLTVTQEDDGTTSLTGAISDQAALHGLLNKIRDLGVALISVEIIDASRGAGQQRQARTMARSPRPMVGRTRARGRGGERRR